MTEIVRYAAGVTHIAGWAETRLKKYMRAAGVTTCLITSTRRTPYDQARIMCKLIDDNGVDYAKRLYGSVGDQVISQYNTALPKLSPTNIAAMQTMIVAVGPERVSNHCSTSKEVFDIAPSSVIDSQHDMLLAAFERGQDLGEVAELEYPPKDPAFHVEFVPGPEHEIVVLPRQSTSSKVITLGIMLAIGWAITRS